MLNGIGQIQNVILVGGSSEIGNAVVQGLRISKDSSLTYIGKSDGLPNLTSGMFANLNFLKCDFTNLKEFQDLIYLIQKMTDIDVVVMSAGVLPDNSLSLDSNAIKTTFQINSIAQIQLIGTFASKMLEQKHGHIICISSLATIRARKSNFMYGASKSSLDFYARGIAPLLEESNVRITVLRPGFVKTKMTEGIKAAPLSITPNQIRLFTLKKDFSKKKNRRVVYYLPSCLFLVSVILRILPIKFISKLER